ncbi:MAG: hemerythrin domain-containing protein [Tetrasphaera sp.]|nr:hemerythrin domain-containing protein [Tetrasphaera sp.]
MTTTEDAVDVREMIVVHTAMLREFRLLPDAVRAVPQGDVRRARPVVDHVRFMLDMLHHHHESEDTLLWPPLRKRATLAEVALIDEGEGQHEELAQVIATTVAALDGWAGTANTEDRATTAAGIERVHSSLEAHLDFEERRLLPLVSTLLTHEEWAAISEVARSAVPPKQRTLALGMFLYEGDPAVVASMMSGTPMLVRKVVSILGRRAYAAHARALYGTASP